MHRSQVRSGAGSSLTFLLLILVLFITAVADAYPQVPDQTSPKPESGSPAPLDAIPVGTNATFDSNFTSLQDFFAHAHSLGLNITIQVQHCQSLCVLSYGFGNPDLSGIGMMFSYTFQVIFTVLFGPGFHVFYLLVHHIPPGAPSRFKLRSSVAEALPELQLVFFEANGFLIFSSAVATLVRLSQKPTIFEIAEMQVLMSVQVCSLLIIFFTLIHPIQRWWQRFAQFVLGFVVANAAMGKSQLSSGNKDLHDWQQASLGCSSVSKAFKTMTPLPYRPWLVGIFAAFCVTCFLGQSATAEQSTKTKHYKSKSPQKWNTFLQALAVFWGLLVIASMVGMFWGLELLWVQRNDLRNVVGQNFQDDLWGFGQVAALFIWAPVPVEISYHIYDWVLETFPVFFLKHTKWAKFAGQRDSVRGRRTVATAPAATAISRTRVSSDEADETAYKKEPIVTATVEDLNGSMHQRSSPSESETQEQQSRAPLLPSTDDTV